MPDTMSWKSTGDLYRSADQLACPPSYCKLPNMSFTGSTSWCGWSDSDGLDDYVDVHLTDITISVKLDVSKLTLGKGRTTLQVWVNPTREGYLWQAEATISDITFTNF